MIKYIHITNGDGAANLLKASNLPGDVLVWRDIMHEGPFPFRPELAEISKIRASYLADYGIAEEDVLRDFKLRDEHFLASPSYDEIVLWFEHDVLDQLQLLQILNWYRQNAKVIGRLKLICIDDHAGIKNFKGLGQLTPDQLEDLFSSRQSVDEKQLNLASRVWQSFTAGEPLQLSKFAQGDHEELPFLGAALRRLLQEYPNLQDGLTRTERQLLELIAQGVKQPAELFTNNLANERVLHIGDWGIFRKLGEISEGASPLIRAVGQNDFQFDPRMGLPTREFLSQRLELTPLGNDVLTGAQNGLQIMDRDFWLGGVHIRSQDQLWVWDQDQNQLTRCDIANS